MDAEIDTSQIGEADLARWARARIAADHELFKNLIVQAGAMAHDDEEYEGDLDFDHGEVRWLDEDGEVYIVGPSCSLYVRSDLGEWGEGTRIWRCGKWVSDVDDDGEHVKRPPA